MIISKIRTRRNIITIIVLLIEVVAAYFLVFITGFELDYEIGLEYWKISLVMLFLFCAIAIIVGLTIGFTAYYQDIWKIAIFGSISIAISLHIIFYSTSVKVWQLIVQIIGLIGTSVTSFLVAYLIYKIKLKKQQKELEEDIYISPEEE